MSVAFLMFCVLYVAMIVLGVTTALEIVKYKTRPLMWANGLLCIAVGIAIIVMMDTLGMGHDYTWWAAAILITIAAIVVLWLIAAIVRKKVGTRHDDLYFDCPYCFRRLHAAKDAAFRCVSSKSKCPEVDDVKLTAYEGGDVNTPIKAQKAFMCTWNSALQNPMYDNCPVCDQETTKRICRHCGNHLPDSTVEDESLIISIVGSRNVGKSHYVGVLINELIERVAGHFNGAMTGFDDTRQRYDDNFSRRLYSELKRLDMTQSATIKTNRPLIFTFTMEDRNNTIRNFTLVFYDTAGEDLDEYDTMSAVSRYICKSAGIIFLLDPMQIWNVRNQLDDEVVSSASSVTINQATRPDDIMTRVSNLIRADKKIAATRKIDIPVAAVFSKLDAIEPLVPAGATLMDTSPHCSAGAFVEADLHNVSSEVEGLLQAWGANAFTQQLNLNYTNFEYFATSALGLGNSPKPDGSINRPNPHRIEDALLWILKEEGVIEGI